MKAGGGPAAEQPTVGGQWEQSSACCCPCSPVVVPQPLHKATSPLLLGFFRFHRFDTSESRFGLISSPSLPWESCLGDLLLLLHP